MQARSAAPSKPVTVEIKDAQGQNVGTAVLSEAPHGVKIKLDVKGLPPGEHSLHIHQNPKCEAPDFKSAGPHFNGASGHSDHMSMRHSRCRRRNFQRRSSAHRLRRNQQARIAPSSNAAAPAH